MANLKIFKNPLHQYQADVPRGMKYKVIDKKEADGIINIF